MAERHKKTALNGGANGYLTNVEQHLAILPLRTPLTASMDADAP
jgi:hypothetical protein